MKLFNFGKKNEEVKMSTCACNTSVEDTVEESCCCSGNSANSEKNDCCSVDTSVGLQNIIVLGAGCKSCHEMYENTKIALNNTGIDLEVEYVTDIEKVVAYGIMSMPGLVVNEKVVSMGKVLKPGDIEKLLQMFLKAIL